MAITLSFNVDEYGDCSKLIFTDTTGAYDATNNTTGYGSPNDTITSATATLKVTLADLTSKTFTLSGFPTTDKTKEYYITDTDLGYSSGDGITDQIIEFTYTVTTDQATILTQNIYQGFYCQVECCVNSMALDIDVECEECLDSIGSDITNAYLMLQGLKYAANCGNVTVFNNTLTQLQKICSTTNCSNCK